MFPIRSTSGRVIAFTGRVTPDNSYGPKYMNSPETPIYHKKENLYGQYESRQEVRKLDLVIMCEGTTDVISAHKAGVKNIVAPLGTALTSEQLERVSKLTKNVLFLFDNDTAGQKALEKAFILSQKLQLHTYAASPSPFKDLDELIQKKPKRLERLINKKVNAYTYLLTEFIKDKDLNNYEDYQKSVSWMESMLKNVISKPFLDFYVKIGFNTTKIDPFQKGSNKAFLNGKKSVDINTTEKRSKQAVFLQHLLYQSEITLPKNILLKFFTNDDIQRVLKYIKRNPGTTRESLLAKFADEDSITILLEDSIFSFFEEESKQEDIENIYNNIVLEYFQRKEREYNTKIAAAEARGKLKESDKLLKEFQELNKEKQKHERNS
jgi:DNA primase